MTPRRAEAAFLVACVALLLAVQSVGIARPFLRHHESVGAEFGKHARNHLKFGLGTTLGLRLDVSGPRLEPYGNHRGYFYPSHPPLPVLLLAGAFAAFGVHEATHRALFMLFSAAAVLLFRAVARRLVPPPYDRAATVLFALFPAFAYYSIVTGLQVSAMTGALAALLFYLRWRESGRRGDYAGMAAGVSFACLCAWPGYYVAPALLVAHLAARRPGRAAVAGLLGVNAAVFGLYALHLWAADPGGLDPLRTLIEMGVSRSSLHAPSPTAYAAGEARELALMFTLPALLLAAAWAASVLRRLREADNALVAGLGLLGLDEILFAAVAARHEFYSYFLAPSLALAAACGLRLVVPRVPPRARAALVAGIGVAFLAQAGWTLERRLRREGAYSFYHRLALAVREATPPEAKILLLTDNIPFYTPYYADRFFRWHDARNRELITENTGGRRPGFGEEDLLSYLRDNPDGMDVAVTADRETLLRELPWMAGLDEEQLRSFGVDPGPSRSVSLLRERHGPPRKTGGFHFWTLRP